MSGAGDYSPAHVWDVHRVPLLCSGLEMGIVFQWCLSWCFPDVALLGRAKWMGRGRDVGETRPKGQKGTAPDRESASPLGSSGGGEEGSPLSLGLKEQALDHY